MPLDPVIITTLFANLFMSRLFNMTAALTYFERTFASPEKVRTGTIETSPGLEHRYE